MKALFLAIALICGGTAKATGSTLPTLTGPVVDRTGLLSPDTRQAVQAAATRFRRSSGYWMVVVATPSSKNVDPSSLDGAWQAPWADAPIGIVYLTSPDEKAGKLFVLDPDWQKAAHGWWIAMFPQRLAEKYGDRPFEERVTLGAGYLAEVFPDKIAFLMQPPDRIGEDSIAFAENMMTVVKWFVYFIILFTFVRTLFPARLREEDNDDFSQELRRLRRERQIW